jgi:tetratricopeptide (TPR) repeat protein
MWNLLIALAAGVLVALGIAQFTSFGWVGGIFPGLIAFVVVYFLLARRALGKVRALMEVAQHELQARRMDKAIQTLEAGFPLARWQFLAASQLHSFLGVIHYWKEDYDQALKHLQKSFARDWMARGMLAALRYRRKDVEGAKKTYEDAVAASKKEGVLWASYAWVLEKEGAHEEALAVLGRGVKANPSDEKLKSCQQTLQNGKKLKLGKVYEELWFQFRLEQPPQQLIGPGFRGNRRALYRGG